MCLADMQILRQFSAKIRVFWKLWGFYKYLARILFGSLCLEIMMKSARTVVYDNQHCVVYTIPNNLDVAWYTAIKYLNGMSLKNSSSRPCLLFRSGVKISKQIVSISYIFEYIVVFSSGLWKSSLDNLEKKWLIQLANWIA